MKRGEHFSTSEPSKASRLSSTQGATTPSNQQEMEQAAQVVEVDPDGDVVLACGEGAEKQKIRVSSAILTRSSPVFRTMMSPRFKEGTLLEANGSVEIELKDDLAADVELLCRVLHYQHDKVPGKIEADRLLRIASLSDKYDLTTATKPMAQSWITACLDEVLSSPLVGSPEGVSCDRLRQLLAVAYDFRHEHMFANISKTIIMKVTSCCATEVYGARLSQALVEIQSRRTRALESIAHGVEGIIDEEATLKEFRLNDDDEVCTRNCWYFERRLQFVLDTLRQRKLWPLSDMDAFSLESVWSSMDGGDWVCNSMDDSVESLRCKGECVSDDYAPKISRVQHTLSSSLRTSKKDASGLCYYCVRSGKSDFKNDCGHTTNAST